VVLVDYFLLRKEVLIPDDLYRKDGRYWFWKGLNPRALFAWCAGFALYLGFSPLLLDKVLGIQTSFPWALGSSLPSMAAAAMIYWILGRKGI
jgi:cytosine/uracil/thiamine/allantoin permease